jgi:hypothetical protein
VLDVVKLFRYTLSMEEFPQEVPVALWDEQVLVQVEGVTTDGTGYVCRRVDNQRGLV